MASKNALSAARAKEVFSTSIDATFAFNTPKSVVIQDWKVGLLNRGLQGGLFFYWLYSSFLGTDKAAYYSEIPIGSVNMYVDGGEFATYVASSTPEYIATYKAMCEDTSKFWSVITSVALTHKVAFGCSSVHSPIRPKDRSFVPLVFRFCCALVVHTHIAG